MGWGRLSTNRIEVSTVPGNHFSLIREPLVANVAAAFRDALARRIQQDGKGAILSAN
jgi:thioesterase domain-containing protein